MSIGLFSTIEDSLFASTGSMWIVAICILIFFFLAFLIAGLEFKYATIFTSPLVLGFVKMGWFPAWIQVVFWIMIVGIGGFLAYTYLSDR